MQFHVTRSVRVPLKTLNYRRAKLLIGHLIGSLNSLIFNDATGGFQSEWKCKVIGLVDEQMRQLGNSWVGRRREFAQAMFQSVLR